MQANDSDVKGMDSGKFEQLLDDVFMGSRLIAFSALVKTMSDDQIKATIERADEAWSKGNFYGLHIRAYMHQQGYGEAEGKPNYEAAIELYEKVMKESTLHTAVAAASNNRATMYQKGQGEEDGKPNYAKAIALYEQAIAYGDVAAMNNRAFMYQKGQGQKDGGPNYIEAAGLYRQASKLRNIDATNSLARMYQKGQIGDGKTKDAEAAKLYQKAIGTDIDQGEGKASALNNLAYIHQHGADGGFTDYKAAIPLYEQAIERGNVAAMCNRAYMYQRGEGGKPKYKEAIDLYERAIERGDAIAMNNRAYMYQVGQGCEGNKPDYEKAIKLYQKAAELDNVDAMRHLAYLYDQGYGNDVKAGEANGLRQKADRLDDKGVMDNLNRSRIVYNTNDPNFKEVIKPATPKTETAEAAKRQPDKAAEAEYHASQAKKSVTEEGPSLVGVIIGVIADGIADGIAAMISGIRSVMHDVENYFSTEVSDAPDHSPPRDIQPEVQAPKQYGLKDDQQIDMSNMANLNVDKTSESEPNPATSEPKPDSLANTDRPTGTKSNLS